MLISYPASVYSVALDFPSALLSSYVHIALYHGRPRYTNSVDSRSCSILTSFVFGIMPLSLLRPRTFRMGTPVQRQLRQLSAVYF